MLYKHPHGFRLLLAGYLPKDYLSTLLGSIKEVEEDAGLYKEFLLWANSPESVEKKKQIYISDFVAVFGRFPEGWAQEELESANGTEVAPAPEEFISPETDGAVNMDDPAV